MLASLVGGGKNQLPFSDSLPWKAAVVLLSVVHMKSDRNSSYK